MMSDADGPGVATAAAAVATGVPTGGGDNTNTGDNSEMKHVWKFIYIDLSFVKSLYGIFVAAELILSLLGLISVSVPKNEGCAYLYSSSYSYYEFTASSCFIVSLVWYILYALAITKKLGFIRWDIAEIVWIGFYIFNYLIGSAVIASKACGQGGYKAAAAFGFLCLIVLIAHEFFEVRAFVEKWKGSKGNSQATPDAEEESKY
ncbi:uncharacterized protein LOC132749326 [Ruditapes philippinarum]|uniref:uncharacterized protein LOC132749326 n=1 Tax=Ruditapes philippinarum TaxID=129788 RepID=UPI00295B1C62|nr:uncharacterized protein LOC132749326 [Ruditapes philippinarum]